MYRLDIAASVPACCTFREQENDRLLFLHLLQAQCRRPDALPQLSRGAASLLHQCPHFVVISGTGKDGERAVIAENKTSLRRKAFGCPSLRMQMPAAVRCSFMALFCREGTRRTRGPVSEPGKRKLRQAWVLVCGSTPRAAMSCWHGGQPYGEGKENKMPEFS